MPSTARIDSPLKTKPEAAEYLRISTRKLDYLVAAGDVAPTRIDGRVLFARAELDRFIASRTVSRQTVDSAAVLATA